MTTIKPEQILHQAYTRRYSDALRVIIEETWLEKYCKQKLVQQRVNEMLKPILPLTDEFNFGKPEGGE